MPAAIVDTREQLLHLLAEASEFEHNLLCCYLYAAFSLKRKGDGDLSSEEEQAVGRWRKAIMSVAIEEMTHLALVANLTVAIGGGAHFNRPNLPVAAGYHPAGFVIELAPFNMDTLAHFIYLERPADIALPDSVAFEAPTDYVRGTCHGAALMPSAHDYETIAQFYQSIHRGFRTLAQELGESRLFTGNPAMQIGEDIASMSGLRAVADLASALAAIDTIVVQGEGSSGASHDSHFARFESIKQEYEALSKERPGFVPAHPAARNPVMRKPADELKDRVYVDAPRAAAMLDLANAVYNHMLRLLALSYRCVDSSSAKRTLIEAAMQLMRVFGAVSEHLTKLPASLAAPGVNAGVSFAVLRATEPPADNTQQRAMIAERFEQLAAGMREVCADVDHLQWGVLELERLAGLFKED